MSTATAGPRGAALAPSLAWDLTLEQAATLGAAWAAEVDRSQGQPLPQPIDRQTRNEESAAQVRYKGLQVVTARGTRRVAWAAMLTAADALLS